jgi:hypothetical protein
MEGLASCRAGDSDAVYITGSKGLLTSYRTVAESVPEAN